MPKRVAPWLCALPLCAAFPAFSAIVQLPGTTVDFFYDDTQPGMAVYGTLTAVGDSILATPTTFRAESQNGGTDTISALGTVVVVAKSGYRFDEVRVAQQGDYQLIGAGTAVSSSATLEVTDSSAPATTISSALTSSSDFGLQDGATHAWASATTVDLSAGLWASVSSIDLTLDSVLNASTATNGELAWIQNKFVGGGMVTIMTMPVPLPASLWLFGAGLALLARFTKARAGR